MMFEGQAVIVTGAGGNLGAAIAADLARRGAKLALADVSADALAKTAAALPKAAASVQIVGVDLRKEADAQRVAAEALNAFGRIDALANTVGTFAMSRIDEDAPTQWAKLMDLNALSALLISRAVLPSMLKAGYGRILHTAAAGGLRGSASMSAYSASKAALQRVVESLAEEVRGKGVTANCILPVTIDTPQNREAMPKADRSSWTTPAAIARAAALLLSRDAGVISGASVPVVGRE